MMSNIKYHKQITEELWSDESGSQFYYKFLNGKSYISGNLDFSKKNWNNDMKISVAKATVEKEKKKNKQITTRIQLTFDDFMKKYINFKDISDYIEQTYYKKYMQNYLGDLLLESITTEDIKDVLIKKQNSFKLNVYEITSRFLIKSFDFAVEKGLLVENPCNDIDFRYIKEEQYMKLIHERIVEIHDIVSILFYNNPLVLSFFFFLINGKKEKDIVTLRWELIDFEYSNYRLKSNRNKINYLHPAIKEELLKVKKQRGYVYPNDIDSDLDIEKPTVKEEIYKINNYIPEFSINFLEFLIEEFQERQTFNSEVSLNSVLGNSNIKQIPQKQIKKPKLKIRKFKK